MHLWHAEFYVAQVNPHDPILILYKHIFVFCSCVDTSGLLKWRRILTLVYVFLGHLVALCEQFFLCLWKQRREKQEGK